MASDLVSARTVAEHFGVTTETIAAWARDGKIPVAQVTRGGHRRFRLDDVVAAAPAPQEARA